MDGRSVAVGKALWLTRGRPLSGRARDVRRRVALEGSTAVFVAIDDELAGALVIDDPIRPDTPRVIRSLRRSGIQRIVMVTGDQPDVAESVGIAIGVDRILSERDPSDKVDAVKAERAEGGVTIMVGDGRERRAGAGCGRRRRRDGCARCDGLVGGGRRRACRRPAGPRGRGDAHREALAWDRHAERARRDGAVVRRDGVRRVRAARAGRRRPRSGGDRRRRHPERAARARSRPRRARPPRSRHRVAEPFREQHREFSVDLQHIRSVADELDRLEGAELRTELDGVRVFLTERLVEHEEKEEADVYPVVAKLLGGEDPMGTMTRAHVEISHLTRVYVTLLDSLPPEGPSRDDLMDLRRVLYGLHAILRLHFAQEEEAYTWLAGEGEDDDGARPPDQPSRLGADPGMGGGSEEPAAV